MELCLLEPASSPVSFQPHIGLDILNIHSKTDCRQAKRDKLLEIASLREYLKEATQKDYLTRIISISKEHSWASIDAGQDLLNEIISYHHMTPEIHQMIHSFRPQTNRLEEAFSGSVWIEQSRHMIETTYILKYPEMRQNVGRKLQWSIRQTGIYQSFNTLTLQSIWIFILPNREPGVESDLIHKLHALVPYEEFGPHPLSIHIYLFRARINGWKHFIAHFEDQVWTLADLALTVEIGDSLPFQETYKDLSDLNYIESRLTPTPPIFCSQRRLAEKLEYLNIELQKQGHVSEQEAKKVQEQLHNLRAQIDSYDTNVDFILKKIHSTTQLVSATISLKSQHTSERMSNQMLKLNKTAVEDSSSMRVITLVTLVYLPSSFVGGFFGMGFFVTSDDTGVHWSTSPHIWIFFIVSVPLTVLTLTYWRWHIGRRFRLNQEATQWQV